MTTTGRKNRSSLRVDRRHLASALLSVAMIASTFTTLSSHSTPAEAQAGPGETASVRLWVESARSEPDFPVSPEFPNGVLVGDQVPTYEYLISVDNTGDPTQARTDGCSPEDAGYPDSCDWPSIRAVPGSAPIYTTGNQDDFNGVLGTELAGLPEGKYLVSILSDGWKVGGAHFTVPLPDTTPNVTAAIHPNPLPAATMRIKVFEDISAVNGQFDAPAEQGLAGFTAIINDTAGELSADVFGNPLCTEYDAFGDPIPGPLSACTVSDANGDIVIPNVGPLRYDVIMTPPEGEQWIETTTLEGSPSWDTWLMEGGTGLDNEFVVAGEPFPWTVFGYVKPTDQLNDTADTGGVSGTIVSASVYLPQTGGLPYYGDIWNGFNGSKITGAVDNAWVALSDLQNGDTAVYVAPVNPDGSYLIENVPDGDYLFTWFDENLNYILDWIQVTVANGEIYDMGTPFLTGWFTKWEGHVYNDANQNGIRDPGEQGIPNYLVVIRDRDNSEIDRMSIAATTDADGYYVLEKGYPMSSWMVLEAYNDRFFGTGVTYQVENQLEPTTILGAGVDVSILPILGQTGRLDWGVHPYFTGEPGVPEHGGIAGSVFYDTTRNELDARYQAAEPWAPGIPNLTVNLYGMVACDDPAGVGCDPSGRYELAADGSYAKGLPLNTTTTESWVHPTGCTAFDVNGNPLAYPDDQAVFLNPGPEGYRCLEGPMMGTQFGDEFAELPGNYGFGDVWLYDAETGEPIIDPETSEQALGAMPAGDYLVEVVSPLDAQGREMYKVVREEDINVFDGDQYVPAVPPPACAGAMHTVDSSNNPNFVAEGGSPYEGMDMPLCDVKLISVHAGKSIAPTFTFFTEVPIPGRWKGYIIDDLALSFNKQDLFYGEKAGMPNAPIGVYDFSNRLLTTIQSDPNGTFEVLLPSTHTVNCPSPSGVCSGMYYILGNDPGQPGALNPQYNPQYRTIGATFEIYPGLIVPADLAPTQIVIGALAGASQFGTPPQCALDAETPQLFAVSKPYAHVNEGDNVSDILTITGDSFGVAQGEVTLNGNGATLPVTSWTDTQIEVDVPAATAWGEYQLAIESADGLSTVNGMTFRVYNTGNGANTPFLFEVGEGKPFATIQAAVDAAAAQGGNPNRDRLVVVYPDTPALWNPNGAYFENVVMYDPVKIQGVGPGGVYADGTPTLGTVIDGRGVAGDTGYADTWRQFVQSLDYDGNQALYEGSVFYLLAEEGEFDAPDSVAIDGMMIQGGDQQGFPNNLAPADPTQKEFAAVQGGGIFANAFVRNLQITNNVLQSNGGAYGGAIRLGTPHLPGDMNDNQNENALVANNRIIANGGTNLAGAIAIFSGADDYEIADNDICGNFSAEYGGGISHYGYSPNGSIHDNRIFFNRSYDEGGGIMIAGELQADPAMLSPGAGPVDVTANLIQNNLANDDGGGLRFLMAGNFTYNVYNNIIVNNISTHEGGGVSLNDAPDVRFMNNTVMKNITTATSVTSNGAEAPAGFSTSYNSDLLQATLPGGVAGCGGSGNAPCFSDPMLFNNIFWDNRAGFYTGNTVGGIGIDGDPFPINYWDLGVAGGVDELSPTYSILQTEIGTVFDATNIYADSVVYPNPGLDPANPLVVEEYDTGIEVLPWRGNPRFVDVLMVIVDPAANVLGDYHLTGLSPAIGEAGPFAPPEDYDGGVRDGDPDIGADEWGVQ